MDLEILSDELLFQSFIDQFTDKKGRMRKPIRRLVEWRQKYGHFCIKVIGKHIILSYDRKAIMKQLHENDEEARKIMQNFERCLMSVKPQLYTIQSTHGNEEKYITTDKSRYIDIK